MHYLQWGEGYSDKKNPNYYVTLCVFQPLLWLLRFNAVSDPAFNLNADPNQNVEFLEEKIYFTSVIGNKTY
jgi:hypothetical protein